MVLRVAYVVRRRLPVFPSVDGVFHHGVSWPHTPECRISVSVLAIKYVSLRFHIAYWTERIWKGIFFM